MATRVVPTSLDADNPAGSFMLAACSDWRSAVRRFHVGTGLHEPTSDAGYTTAGSPLLPQLSINLLPCGRSPYTRVRPHQALRILNAAMKARTIINKTTKCELSVGIGSIGPAAATTNDRLPVGCGGEYTMPS